PSMASGLGGHAKNDNLAAQAPFSHFFMKLVFAAPESGLPSALTALFAHASAMHFFMNDVFAAPASGLPSLPTALVSQASCANAAPPANVRTNAANINFLSMGFPLLQFRAPFGPVKRYPSRHG